VPETPGECIIAAVSAGIRRSSVAGRGDERAEHGIERTGGNGDGDAVGARQRRGGRLRRGAIGGDEGGHDERTGREQTVRAPLTFARDDKTRTYEHDDERALLTLLT
jgi:hypothetical protein